MFITRKFEGNLKDGTKGIVTFRNGNNKMLIDLLNKRLPKEKHYSHQKQYIYFDTEFYYEDDAWKYPKDVELKDSILKAKGIRDIKTATENRYAIYELIEFTQENIYKFLETIQLLNAKEI